MKQQSVTENSKRYDFTTQPTIRPACAGCGYITTTKPIPGQPFQFQNPVFQKAPVSPNAPSATNQGQPTPTAPPQSNIPISQQPVGFPPQQPIGTFLQQPNPLPNIGKQQIPSGAVNPLRSSGDQIETLNGNGFEPVANLPTAPGQLPNPAFQKPQRPFATDNRQPLNPTLPQSNILFSQQPVVSSPQQPIGPSFQQPDFRNQQIPSGAVPPPRRFGDQIETLNGNGFGQVANLPAYPGQLPPDVELLSSQAIPANRATNQGTQSNKYPQQNAQVQQQNNQNNVEPSRPLGPNQGKYCFIKIVMILKLHQ